MKTFKSTSSTSLGLPLGYALKPGASVEISNKDAALILATPYVAAWITAGHLVVADKEPVRFEEG